VAALHGSLSPRWLRVSPQSLQFVSALFYHGIEALQKNFINWRFGRRARWRGRAFRYEHAAFPADANLPVGGAVIGLETDSVVRIGLPTFEATLIWFLRRPGRPAETNSGEFAGAV
jgi:hypothetical protein